MIEAIDLEDPETLALFLLGTPKGFQFEQAGAIRLLRRVRPNHFESGSDHLSIVRASDYDSVSKARPGKS
ncbi:MAG: hypothetical protein ACLS6U_09430 [Streptococcus salivarius]